MRVQDVDSAIWEQLQRKKNMGFFGTEELGSAVADQIIDDANKTWTDEQIQSAKAKWREMVLNLNNAVGSRNDVIAAIKKMPAGVERDQAIYAFQDADSTFMQAYQQAQPIFQEIGSLTGDNFPVANEANFGVAPLVIWGLVAASLVAVAYISTSMYESHLKYDAIVTNPKVAPYVTGGSSGFFNSLGDGVGSGLKWGILALAGVWAVSSFMKKA